MYNISQVNFEDISDSIDIFIAASGYESRCTLQAKSISKPWTKSFILGFKEFHDNDVRIENDAFFKNHNPVYSSINSKVDLDRIVKMIFKSLDETTEQLNEKINVYVDYSSMPKNWYAEILIKLYYYEKSERLNLFFGYSHSEYIPHNETDKYNEYVKPIEGFSNLSLPVYKTNLILTLGNNKAQVLGIKDYFDINPYLVYSDNSYNPDFSQEIESKHSELINSVEEIKIFKLPVHDLTYSYNILLSLSSALINESRIIFAPCGPKPFTLLNLLISLNLKYNADVWRISQGNNSEPLDRKATGLKTVVRLNKSNMIAST